MGKYIIELDARLPGKGVELLTSTYTDKSNHRGFPELVLFPWSPHPGTENQYTEARTQEDAADAVAQISDRFNYLPIACITERGILEAFAGDFKADDLPAYATSAAPGPLTRKVIDELQSKYLDKLMREGVEIPSLGRSHVKFDTRTGFYVMDVFPDKYLNSSTLLYNDYTDLLMKLESREDREKVLEYKIKYRTFDSYKMKTPDTLIDGTPVKRNFIFERPDKLRPQFQELGITLPPRLIPFVISATERYQRNLAEKREREQDIRGADEARRLAEEARQKIQESLEIIAKAKAEREAERAAERAAGRGRGRGRGRGTGRGRTFGRARGGRRYGITRKSWRQMGGDDTPNLVLAEYKSEQIDPNMESYIGSTMKNLWKTFLMNTSEIS